MMSTANLVRAAGDSTVADNTMVPPKSASTAKQNAKMHRRSRTGCFTCRLRRKKCDEGKPCCRACRHLGLKCEYKRPMWWGNNEQRKQQKEEIKNIIRRTKLSEKTAQMMSLGTETPPMLSHSVPTSDTYSDRRDRTRAVSEDSQFSLDFDFNRAALQGGFCAPPHPLPHAAYYPPPPPGTFSPYDVDVKTERQTFVNDVPTRRDSSLSSFSTFHPPSFDPLAPLPPSLGPEPGLGWPCDDVFDPGQTPMNPIALGADLAYFDLAQVPPVTTTTQQAVLHVDEGDQRLLDHFVNNVLRLIFPVLEVTRIGSARSEVVLPALETNRCYLHCCLSVAALHMKATQGLQGEQIDDDIMRHRYATIAELCEALNRDTDHQQILEATLGLIFFQCTVGRPDDCLPDIPWNHHFQAVFSLVQKLDLTQTALGGLTEAGAGPSPTPFNMTLTSWIDIFGATMLGRGPLFADTYREKYLGGSSTGLRELMGCDDRVMYLISEMACLEALKRDGMDELQLCDHITALATSLGETEPQPGAVAYPYSATGALRPRQLTENLTTVFRFAARLYLCSLVPGYDRHQTNIVDLVSKLTEALEYIPAGPDGFDRSLVWPYLIAGAAATPGSSFRLIFPARVQQLGELAESGSFGRVVRLLEEVWRQADEQRQTVHWRDVMQQKGWDYLLI